MTDNDMALRLAAIQDSATDRFDDIDEVYSWVADQVRKTSFADVLNCGVVSILDHALGAHVAASCVADYIGADYTYGV